MNVPTPDARARSAPHLLIRSAGRSASMAKRRSRPLSFTLVTSTDDGRSWTIHINRPDGSVTGFTLYDYLLSRESVRFDNLQMFANRYDEDAFVASLHFPFTSGQARQT